MIKLLIYRIFCLLPIKQKKVFFFGYYGAQYGCSPKYISEYISIHDSSYDIVWGALYPEKLSNPRIRVIRYASLRFYFELATSQFLFTNYRLPADLDKRKGQIYFQTWHSSLRLKKIEADAEKSLPSNYILQAKKDSTQIDFLISGCKESTHIFRRAFWYNGPILEIGTGRIDPIINQSTHDRTRIINALGIDVEIKILLYAPTFRKNDDYSCYIQNFSSIIEALQRKFSGEWKVLVRLHPHLINKSASIVNQPGVIDVTKHADIQELLIVADFVITDYSSLMFDYLFSKKPLLLYVPDLKVYLQQDRELYYNIEELPFLKAYSNPEVTNQIASFEREEYLQGVEEFIHRIGSYEKGDSSKKVLDILNKITNGETI